MSESSENRAQKIKSEKEKMEDVFAFIKIIEAEEEKRRKENGEPEPKKYTAEETAAMKRAQLYWFVNKLISLSEKPTSVQFYEYDSFIDFPVTILREEKELFPLGNYPVGLEDGIGEYTCYCNDMLSKIKSDLDRNKLHFDTDKFSWIDCAYSACYAPTFYINCDYKPLLEAYLRYMDGEKARSSTISLEGKRVRFDENTSAIIINEKKCSLPAFKNEYSLANAIFSYDIDEPVDWSIIYKEMSGSKASIGSSKNKKTLTDTIDRLNDRIKKFFGTKDKLISCENNSVKRNY
jgi:hypothetical protein